MIEASSCIRIYPIPSGHPIDFRPSPRARRLDAFFPISFSLPFLGLITSENKTAKKEHLFSNAWLGTESPLGRVKMFDGSFEYRYAIFFDYWCCCCCFACLLLEFGWRLEWKMKWRRVCVCDLCGYRK